MLRPLRAAAFKYADGVWPNRLAIGYAGAGHALAIGLLGAAAWPARLAGVLLAAHTLLIGAYLVHECIHESVFRDRRRNARLGAALAWLCGGGLAGYERLRRKHLHHHLDRLDPLAFDYPAYLAARPRLRRAVRGLEWAHVPAVELLLRLAPLLCAARGAPFAAERARLAAVLASRLAWAAALVVLGGPMLLALYAAGYLLFVVAARAGDAFHHTYEVVLVRDYDLAYGPPPGRDRAYEQAHTFTNPLSTRWPWLNLAALNFSLHNAHHEKPGTPWHRLPGLDRTLFGGDARQVVPLRRLLADFHRHRLARLEGDAAASPAASPAAGARLGAVGVSLLTI